MHERQNASIESEVQLAAKTDHLISSSRVLQGYGGVFKGFTVLIVENDIDAREVIEYWLQSQGATVDAAVQCTGARHPRYAHSGRKERRDLIAFLVGVLLGLLANSPAPRR